MVLKFGTGRGYGHSNRRTQTSFTPLSLFAASEVGAWYDPSDLSTLFQDAAGTTPVTAAGQVVGLMLDKSLGLVLGAERVTNGGFDSGAAGWNARAGCTLSVVDGWLRLTYTGTGAARANFTTLTTVVGRTYKVSFAVRNTASTTTAAFFAYSDAFATQISTSGVKTAAGSYEMVFTATSTTTNIEVGNNASNGGVGAYLEFDNISVRELPGNHASQTTTASKPILQQSGGRYYLAFDGVDDYLVTGSINFTATDKMTVLAGVRKPVENNNGTITELSAAADTNPGAFFLRASGGGAANYQWAVRSASATTSPTTSAPAPDTSVLGLLNDLGSPTTTTRRNGVQASGESSPTGGGTFGNYPLYIGRRGGTTLPFNGQLYGLIVRGATTDAATIAKAESWLNARTGAY